MHRDLASISLKHKQLINHSLHWLPFGFKVDFSLFSKSFNGLAPLYSFGPASFTKGPQICSSSWFLRRNLKLEEPGAFSAVCPKLWKSLRSHIKVAHVHSRDCLKGWIIVTVFPSVLIVLWWVATQMEMFGEKHDVIGDITGLVVTSPFESWFFFWFNLM